MRVIDADDLDEKGIEFTDTNGYVPIEAIRNAPTIEAEPVRYGEWILDEYGNPHCSVCEHVQDAQTNYCSECGAKMDGGDQSE